MKRRYVAKSWPKGRRTVWGVYDTFLGSWPIQRQGLGAIAQELPDETAAQAEADRIEAFYA